MSDEEWCRETNGDGYFCTLVLNHKEDHMARTFMDGFVYATWPRVEIPAPVKVDYDPRNLNVVETMRVGELQVWMDRVVRDCDQESACKILYHYDLQRKRLDIIQATPPSRRTT